MCSVVPRSSTAAWCSWYMWSFIGSTYPSVSNINSAWSRDGVWMVLLPSTWLLTVFQSLQLNQSNICVLLVVISWLGHHIDWVTTDVGPSLLLVRRCGTLYRNSCVILFTPPPSLVVYWRLFSQSTSVYSALGADFSVLMRYINSRFTYFYLLQLKIHLTWKHLQCITNTPFPTQRLPMPEIQLHSWHCVM